MKNSIKTKIVHLFKNKKSHESLKDEENERSIIEGIIDGTGAAGGVEENSKTKSKFGKGKKLNNNKKSKNKLFLNTKLQAEFPVLPSPIYNKNESSKLTAMEFAKAVGIKILHHSDEEEDEECDCEYCIANKCNGNNNYSVTATPTTTPATANQHQLLLNANLVLEKAINNNNNNIKNNEKIENLNSAITSSSENYSIQSNPTLSSTVTNITTPNSNTPNSSNIKHELLSIPPFPINDIKLISASSSSNTLTTSSSSCSCASSISTTRSNTSLLTGEEAYINSKTISTPGYYCHNHRKNSASRVIDMSLFIPPTPNEAQQKNHSPHYQQQQQQQQRGHIANLSISSNPENHRNANQVSLNRPKILGGSLDRNAKLNSVVTSIARNNNNISGNNSNINGTHSILKNGNDSSFSSYSTSSSSSILNNNITIGNSYIQGNLNKSFSSSSSLNDSNHGSSSSNGSILINSRYGINNNNNNNNNINNNHNNNNSNNNNNNNTIFSIPPLPSSYQTNKGKSSQVSSLYNCSAMTNNMKKISHKRAESSSSNSSSSLLANNNNNTVTGINTNSSENINLYQNSKTVSAREQLNASNLYSSQSHIQFKNTAFKRCDSGTELSNSKILLPSSNTSLNSSSLNSSTNNSYNYNSLSFPKKQNNLKITRSVTVSEGTRQAEIDIQPNIPDEVQVYTKGRFTITREHSRRPSVHTFQLN